MYQNIVFTLNILPVAMTGVSIVALAIIYAAGSKTKETRYGTK